MLLMIHVGIKHRDRIRIASGFFFQGAAEHAIIKFFEIVCGKMFVFFSVISLAEKLL